MKVQPTIHSDSFDLYDLGFNRNQPQEHMPFGFRGLDLDLESAQKMAHANRQQGYATVVVPTAYREANLTLAEARHIALDAFEHRKHLEPSTRFGELDSGSDEGGWWLFMADDLTAQDAGVIPGIFLVRIDKLLRRSLNLAEIRWVDILQVDSSAGRP